MKLLEVIGHGTYGQVHKAVWRGKIVAAKVIPAPSINQKIIDNELSVLRLAQQPYRVICSFVNLLVFLAGCLQKLQSSQFAADDGCRHHSFQRRHCYESCGWLQPR